MSVLFLSDQIFSETCFGFFDGDSKQITYKFCFNPGWICYAEKTHGDFVLPYISTTRSPQQMMGSLVKGYFAEQQVQEHVNPL